MVRYIGAFVESSFVKPRFNHTDVGRVSSVAAAGLLRLLRETLRLPALGITRTCIESKVVLQTGGEAASNAASNTKPCDHLFAEGPVCSFLRPDSLRCMRKSGTKRPVRFEVKRPPDRRRGLLRRTVGVLVYGVSFGALRARIGRVCSNEPLYNPGAFLRRRVVAHTGEVQRLRAPARDARCGCQ